MKKKYAIAAVVGRFEPMHNGHLPLFKKAAEIADHVICIIGSANMPRMPKNPFTANERQYMISESLVEAGVPVPTFAFVEDSIYLDQAWYIQVKEHVAFLANRISSQRAMQVEGKRELLVTKLADKHDIAYSDTKEVEMQLHLHGHNTAIGKIITEIRRIEAEIDDVSVAIVGHNKDNDGDDYHAGFSNWDKVDVGAFIGDWKHDRPISATDIREHWFKGQLSYAKGNLSKAVYKFMSEFDDATYLRMVDEYNYVVDFKAKNQKGEYETQFLTSDAVVMHGDEVLTIVRGEYPGKGLRALPGGFKKPTEGFKDACLRELREETGIKVPLKVLRGSIKEEKVFDHPDRSSRGTTVTTAYLIVLDPTLKRPKVTGLDDADKAEWLPLADFLKRRNELFEDHFDIGQYMTSRI